MKILKNVFHVIIHVKNAINTIVYNAEDDTITLITKPALKIVLQDFMKTVQLHQENVYHVTHHVLPVL